VVSPVAELVKEGVAARYEQGDLPTRRRPGGKGLPLPDKPGVAPLERYRVYAGLGLIHAKRKEYARAKEFFLRAGAASREVPDNRKPLSYAHYNLACAESLLGENEAALESLRAALEAERQTERRRYVKLAGGDSPFAGLKDAPRFQALLKEVAEPADGPGGAEPRSEPLRDHGAGQRDGHQTRVMRLTAGPPLARPDARRAVRRAERAGGRAAGRGRTGRGGDPRPPRGARRLRRDVDRGGPDGGHGRGAGGDAGAPARPQRRPRRGGRGQAPRPGGREIVGGRRASCYHVGGGAAAANLLT